MKTVRSLKPSEALLVGRLFILHESRKSRQQRYARPTLHIEVWCPYCKSMHGHGFDDPPFRQNVVSHRVSHCYVEGSPLKDRGYFVGLNPAFKSHNIATIKSFIDQMAKSTEEPLIRHQRTHLSALRK